MTIFRHLLFWILATVAFFFLGDDLLLRLRIHRGGNAYGQVTVHRLDAIPEKNGKVEYVPEDPVVETCIHSVFPHIGYLPCWYLSRRTEQRVSY